MPHVGPTTTLPRRPCYFFPTFMHPHGPCYQVNCFVYNLCALFVCLLVCLVLSSCYVKKTRIYIYTAPARKGAASFLFTYIGLRHAGTLATLAQDKHTQTHTPYSGSPPGIGTPSLPKRTVRHYLPHVQQRQKTSSTYSVPAILAILLPLLSLLSCYPCCPAAGRSCYNCYNCCYKSYKNYKRYSCYNRNSCYNCYKSYSCYNRYN